MKIFTFETNKLKMTHLVQNEFLTIRINSKGAELNSIKSGEKEFIWNGNPEFWGKHSPVLFPIVGSLKNNVYSYQNKEYSLKRHGFARDLEFVIVEKLENSIVFSLKANENTLENYPFDFELQIKYTLDEKILTIKYRVINNSDEKMPFSIGAHPAFSLSNGFENYSLEFSDDDNIEYYLLDNGIISSQKEEIILKNKVLDLKYKTFENDALVFKKLKSKSITILEKSIPYIKVRFYNFPNLGLWTAKSADFICIEPWFGYSDTINSNGKLLDKEGIIVLEKKQTFETEFSIKIF